MAVQFGRWNAESRPAERNYLDQVRDLIAPYASGDGRTYSSDGLTMVYYGFPTTLEACGESQPLLLSSGAVLIWDGRLDNREQLISELGRVVNVASTDASIVAAAYIRWKNDCFAKLTGDWAITIAHPSTRSLILARDFTGIRPLYYEIGVNEITWSTILDPLVRLEGKTLKVEEEYLAGWLASFPPAHLTPYVGIFAVPPGSFLEWDPKRMRIRTHWELDPSKEICYQTDTEYETHFRMLFSQSVRRRLRSHTPVLAELSGGIDSSAIVCMADWILQNEDGRRLETISYFSDSEPNWNERPYFTKVEESRGRPGFHVEMDWSELFRVDRRGRFDAVPASLATPAKVEEQLNRHIFLHGFRVVLSGFGGDEVLGGVPTPIPELADLLVQGSIGCFVRRLKLWALFSRKPLIQLLTDVLTAFLPSLLSSEAASTLSPYWLEREFVRRHRTAFHGYSDRLRLLGPRPSFLEGLNTLRGLQRQIACFPLPSSPPYEKRYPYLDRDLLEFLYAIPREQLIRPGERRSLMRRALAGVVPREVLNRRGKSYISRFPHVAVAEEWECLISMTGQLMTGLLGIVDKGRFLAALEQAKQGDGIAIVGLIRTILLEVWLSRLARSNCRVLGPA